ncbi:probable methyltransferase-like protein 24 [Mya arenaria]|uniref:probable methyltransferase-like protein 24 n=1 Tax=Mya arenaria TaxID=6604 RepID=UPI0022E2A04F|nr:probable methyltransferase-like protein 24 [Mya arenaria]
MPKKHHFGLDIVEKFFGEYPTPDHHFKPNIYFGSEEWTFDETIQITLFSRYINSLQVLCKDVIRVGSLSAGGKEICIDEQYKPKPPCLVYSFGINNQFDFDEDINRLFGCDVFCFDPSMKTKSFRKADQIWFYNWGLGGENTRNELGWQIKTVDVIRKELNHTNRPIDILKIDIEGDEWYSIPQMISSGALDDVKQISMETHFISKTPGGQLWGSHPIPPADELYTLRLLYDEGFRICMRERNLYSKMTWPGFNNSITNVNKLSLIKSMK